MRYQRKIIFHLPITKCMRNNEFYVAPVYNYAIARGGKFGIYSIDKTQMHGTGTPEDLDKYIELKNGALA